MKVIARVLKKIDKSTQFNYSGAQAHAYYVLVDFLNCKLFFVYF